MIQRGKSSCGTEFYFQKIHTLFNCFVLAMSTHRCYSLRTTATSVWTACVCVCVCVCVLQVRYHSDISFTSPSPFDFLCIALPGKLTYSLFFCFFVLFFSPPRLFFSFFCAICPFVRNRTEKRHTQQSTGWLVRCNVCHGATRDGARVGLKPRNKDL